MLKIIKILKFTALGILLPISIQSMETYDESSIADIPIVPLNFSFVDPVLEAGQNSDARFEALESKIASLSTSVGVKKDLSKAYQVWEIELQYIFYPFCDPKPYAKESWYQKSWAPEGETKNFWHPEERVARLRLHTEETKNLTYSRSTSATLRFSLQPIRRVDLKNIVGIEIEQWFALREKAINDIKAAYQDWKNWRESTPSLMYTADRLERHVKAREFSYHTMMLQYARKRTLSKEVISGERYPNEAEIKDLDVKAIHPKTPTVFISSPSGYSPLYAAAVGTSYKSTVRPELVKGFTILEGELPRFYEALERRLGSLKREYDILTDVWLIYSKDFLPEVEGWLNLGNWVLIKSKAEEYRKIIKTKIENKFPPAADPSDKALLQNEFERLRKLRKFLSEIRKFPTDASPEVGAKSEDPFQEAYEDPFQRVYTGLDDIAKCEDTSLLEKSVRFQSITSRYYLNDEERFEIQMMWKNPSDHSLGNLGINKIALFFRGVNEACKVKDCGEMQLGLYNTDYEFLRRLKNAIEHNMAPSPEDRRQLLDFLIDQKLIKRNKEPFSVPKGAQMATTIRSVGHAMVHRVAWNEKQEIWNPVTKVFEHLSVFDQIKNPPALKPTFAPNIDYKEKYDELSQEFITLLNGKDLKIGYVQLLQYMYQPYKEGKTRIPRGWKFFISETYKRASGSLPDLTEIDLSQCLITDADLDVKGKNNIFLRLFGCPFVNLSQNSLTGKISYPFTNLKHLLLAENQLVSLNFLSNLTQLVRLNLSKNKLSDLSVFFTKADENLAFLEELDLSSNEIKDASFLSKLTGLVTLNVSDNKIASLKELTQMGQATNQTSPKKHALKSLKANNNALEGHWTQVLPQECECLAELELNGNKQLTVSPLGESRGCFRPKIFQTYYPNLIRLHTDMGQVENLKEIVS